MGEANNPVLVVMAAGMGSRYGGLKQIDPKDTIVSMNLWGFRASILTELKERFGSFLRREIPAKSRDRWYGVTYKEDKETVVQAIRGLKEQGLYPEKLWEE